MSTRIAGSPNLQISADVVPELEIAKPAHAMNSGKETFFTMRRLPEKFAAAVSRERIWGLLPPITTATSKPCFIKLNASITSNVTLLGSLRSDCRRSLMRPSQGNEYGDCFRL